MRLKIILTVLMFCLLSTVSLAENLPEHIEGEAVFFADSLEKAEEIAEYYNADLKNFSNGIGVLTGIDDNTFDKKETTGMMARSAFVVPEIFPNYIFYTCEGQNTNDLGDDVILGWYHDKINTSDAWKVTKGKGVIVAIIDSGIDESHEDLSNNIKEVKDFYSSDDEDAGNTGTADISGHGTHVAGIVAAVENDIGTTGVAPEVELMILKALDATVAGGAASGSLYDIATAVVYAANNGADVINMSISAEGVVWTAFEKLFKDVDNKGIIVVCAAGNSHSDTENIPASYASTISVAASTSDDAIAYYSNFGSWVDIAAPGSSIYSTLPGDKYGSMTGTSMATPVISGVCALIKAVNPQIDTREEVLPYLEASINTVTKIADDNASYTYKVVNASDAVQLAYDGLYPNAVTAADISLSAEEWFVDAEKSINLNASNGSGEYVFEVKTGELPGGLILNNGCIAGKLISASGASSVIVRISDKNNLLEYKDITVAFPKIQKKAHDSLYGTTYVLAEMTGTYSFNLSDLPDFPLDITSKTYGTDGIDRLITLTDTNGLINGTVTISADGIAGFSVNAKESTTTAQVTLKMASQNYNDIDITLNIESKLMASQLQPSWTAVAVDDIVYGAKVKDAFEITGNTMLATYGENNENQAELSGTYYITDGESIPNSGTYTAQYSFKVNTGDYADIVFSATSEITVERKTITEDMVSLVQNSDSTAIDTVITDGINTETVIILTENADYIIATEDTENEYEKKATITGTGNYTGTIEKIYSTKIKISGTVTITNNDIDESGTITSGDTITAVNSGIIPETAQDNIVYKWLLNGELSENTDAGYTIPAESAGKTVTVKITGENGYKGEITSNIVISYLPLVKKSFAINSVSNIVVGTELTLTEEFTGTYSLSWYRGQGTETGSAIEGATGSTYTITATDLGKRITAVATGTGEYQGMVTAEGVETSVPTAPVITATKSEKSITVSWSALNNGNSEITGYVSYISEDGTNYTATGLASTVLKMTYKDLASGTYYFKVIAQNAVGNSIDSNVISKTISSSSGGGGGGGGSSSSSKADEVTINTNEIAETETAVIEEAASEVVLSDELIGEIEGEKEDTRQKTLPATEEELNTWENHFEDVNSESWYCEGVRYVEVKGLMNGISNDEFSPKSDTTRAMLIRILWNLAGHPEVTSRNPFKDVENDKWYTIAIIWAKENGIANGYNDEEFGPSEVLTREQLITILFNYMDFEVLTAQYNLEKFGDESEISNYAINAMNWAVGEGIISGVSDTELEPKGTTTRGQLAVMLERLFNR